MQNIEMHLEREDFVITYDSSQQDVASLIAIVQTAGFTAQISTETQATLEPLAIADLQNPPAFFVDALAQAKSENRPLVLDLYAAWCAPCKKMEAETFPDSHVARLLEQTVFLKIDTDEYPDLAKSLSVVGLPDIRFLDSNGEQIKKLQDYQDAESFAAELKTLLMK